MLNVSVPLSIMYTCETDFDYIIIIYRKSLNRSPRLLLVQLSQTPACNRGPASINTIKSDPRLVFEAWPLRPGLYSRIYGNNKIQVRFTYNYTIIASFWISSAKSNLAYVHAHSQLTMTKVLSDVWPDFMKALWYNTSVTRSNKYLIEKYQN